MDGTKLQQTAADAALALPEADVSQPFGPGAEVYKVRGKMFMMTSEGPGPKFVTLKCDPVESEALRQSHESITPGYHMNKRHWISIAVGEGITEQLVEELVADAYELVVRRLPKPIRTRLLAK